MCGIAAIVDFSGPVDAGALQRMCDAMVHRGPDSGGLHLDEGVGLGARRLAIIDVVGGDQPVFSEDRAIAVVMNGEIYNHAVLRDSLLARGHTFSSAVDTEVIVHLYEEHGDDLVHELRGMYAFALWDRRRRRLLCARDRVGKKPLFWARRGDRYWFASELWALLQAYTYGGVDPHAVDAYLAYQYVPHPLSAITGVEKLPPASRLIIDEAGPRVDRYWKLRFDPKNSAATQAELEDELLTRLDAATRARMVSEVPLGAFLSGGIDSSAVVASMAMQATEPVKTFSIAFTDDAFDETRFARQVAERYGTDHHEFTVTADALAIMPRLARHYGEPYADPSAVPSFYLAELARRHVTVALNGDGGDESFAGYGRYPRAEQVRRILGLPAPIRQGMAWGAGGTARLMRSSRARGRLERMARLVTMEQESAYPAAMSAFDRERRSRLFTPEFAETAMWDPERVMREAAAALPEADSVDRLLGTDIETYLPDDLLVKMDIATMASSVEARSPFLDTDLMEFAAVLPVEYKLRRGQGKIILKSALRKRLPDEVLDRPKMGFGVPIGRWLREDLSELPAELLLDGGALSRGYFRRAELESLIHEHQTGTADHSMRLWTLLQLEMWHREVLEAREPAVSEHPGAGRAIDPRSAS